MEAIGEVMPDESLRAIKRDLKKKDIYRLPNDIIRERKTDERSNSSQKEKSSPVKDRS